MRIAVEELSNRLKSATADTLPPIILMNGNEPLLMEEALDHVRSALKQLGFAERIKHQLEAGFEWGKITGVGQAMSLFSERRLVELRVPKSLGAPGTKALSEYVENPSVDDILVVIMPLLDKRQRQSKWATAVGSKAWMVDFPEISPAQFPAWLKQRIQSRALRVENGVIDLLVQQLEGNVLAAAQEIDKLQVLATEGAVTLQLVNESLADQAQFDVYALTDICLSGDFNRALRIKGRLQSEEIEPVIVVWSLVREIRTLVAISSGLASGQNRSQLFKQNRVWSKREPAVNAALSRLSLDDCHALLEQAAHLDQTAKGQRFSEVGPVWYQIEQLCGKMCGVDPLKQAS